MLESTIFKETYDGESLYDLGRDIGEAFIEDYNPKMKGIPQDEYGFHKGTFVVTVVWIPDEEGDENA